MLLRRFTVQRDLGAQSGEPADRRGNDGPEPKYRSDQGICLARWGRRTQKGHTTSEGALCNNGRFGIASKPALALRLTEAELDLHIDLAHLALKGEEVDQYSDAEKAESQEVGDTTADLA